MKQAWSRTGAIVCALGCSILAAGSAMSAQSTTPQTTSAARPWMNAKLSPDERAALVVKQMTLDEKIRMVHGIGWGVLRPGEPVPPGNNGGAGQVLGVPRLGIPDINQADSAVGIRGTAAESRYATLLPSVDGAASSWDPKAAFLYGDVIGRELRAEGFNQSIGGGVDITRDPRNGRTFEYAGEDPVLAGVTVGNLIRGVQSNQVMGDIKHYAFNDQETGRTIVNALIGHKAAHESDLLAFEIGIRIGNPASVMCSYNKVNGDWSCENDWLLNQVLKGEWHYPGFVVSDWGGTHTTVKAALAGLDMEQPGDKYFGPALKQAIQDGKVPEARLDNMVERILRSMFANGVIDHPPTPRYEVNPFQGRDDAEHIEDESIVLLKNENHVLPLDPSSVHSIAVIGAHADVGVMSGGGSAQVDAPDGNAIAPGTQVQWGKPVYFPSAPLKYIREHAPNADVQFASGDDVAQAAELARKSDVAIVFADEYMSEGMDTPTLELPHNQDALIEAVAKANPHTVVVLITGSAVTMPWVDNVAGIMEAWYPGIGGGQSIANVLFGTVDPSGKLALTFPKSIEQLPHPAIFGMTPEGSNGSMPESLTHKEPEKSFPADYTEGARVGYKWFESEHRQPLFAFGYGLSYTTFQYSDLHVDAAEKSVSFTLTNTGQRSGTEIAEVYVHLPASAGENYDRLAGWQRVELAPGASQQVHVKLEPLALAVWDTATHAWQWPTGEYTVRVGGASNDLPLDAQADLHQ